MSSAREIDWPAVWTLGFIAAVTGGVTGLLPTAIYPSMSLLHSAVVLSSHVISGFVMAVALAVFRTRLRMGIEVYSAMIFIGAMVGVLTSVMLGNRGLPIIGDLLFGGFLGCIVALSAKLFDYHHPNTQDEATCGLYIPCGISYGTGWRTVGQLNGWWP